MGRLNSIVHFYNCIHHILDPFNQFPLLLFRYIELKNCLKVLLVSDPTTKTSGAALDIKIGSFHDDYGERLTAKETIELVAAYSLTLCDAIVKNPDGWVFLLKDFVKKC